MRINFAHIRERAAAGGWIDFAVFEARSTSRTTSADARILADLTVRARRAGHKVDQSALAYEENGQLKYYGSKNLVGHLAQRGLPRWTHFIDVSS